MQFARGGVVRPSENPLLAPMKRALLAAVPDGWTVVEQHAMLWVRPWQGPQAGLTGVAGVVGREDEAARRLVAQLVEQHGCCDQGLIAWPYPCPWHVLPGGPN